MKDHKELVRYSFIRGYVKTNSGFRKRRIIKEHELGEYVRYDQAATMLAAKDAELILMKSDRDGWRWMIGEIASSVPLNLSLKVNGSIRDLIYYLKGLAKRAEEAEYRVAELECEIEAIGSHDDKALK